MGWCHVCRRLETAEPTIAACRPRHLAARSRGPPMPPLASPSFSLRQHPPSTGSDPTEVLFSLEEELRRVKSDLLRVSQDAQTHRLAEQTTRQQLFETLEERRGLEVEKSVLITQLNDAHISGRISQHAVEGLEAVVAKLQLSIKAKDKEAAEASRKQEQAMEELARDLNEAKAKLEKATEDATQTHAHLESLKSQLHSATEQTAALEDTAARASASETSCAELRSQVESLTAECGAMPSLQMELGKAQDLCSSLQSQLEAAKEQNARLEEQRLAVEGEKATEDATQTHAHLESLKSQLHSATEQTADLELQLKAAWERVAYEKAGKASVEQKLTIVTRDLDFGSQHETQLEAQIKGLESKAKDAAAALEDTAARASASETSCAELRSQVESLTAECGAMPSLQMELGKAQDLCSSLQSQLEAAKEQNARLEEQRLAVEGEKATEDATQTHAHLESLKSQLHSATEQTADLELQLKAAWERVAYEKAGKASVEQKLTIVTRDLDFGSQHETQLEAQIKGLESKAKDAAAALEDTAARASASETSCAELRTQVESLTAECGAMPSLQMELGKAQELCTALRSQLMTAKKQNASLERRRLAVEDGKSTADSSLKACQETLATTEAKSAELSRALKAAESKAAKVTSEKAQMQETVRRLRGELAKPKASGTDCCTTVNFQLQTAVQRNRELCYDIDQWRQHCEYLRGLVPELEKSREEFKDLAEANCAAAENWENAFQNAHAWRRQLSNRLFVLKAMFAAKVKEHRGRLLPPPPPPPLRRREIVIIDLASEDGTPTTQAPPSTTQAPSPTSAPEPHPTTGPAPSPTPAEPAMGPKKLPKETERAKRSLPSKGTGPEVKRSRLGERPQAGSGERGAGSGDGTGKRSPKTSSTPASTMPKVEAHPKASDESIKVKGRSYMSGQLYDAAYRYIIIQGRANLVTWAVKKLPPHMLMPMVPFPLRENTVFALIKAIANSSLAAEGELKVKYLTKLIPKLSTSSDQTVLKKLPKLLKLVRSRLESFENASPKLAESMKSMIRSIKTM